MERERAWLLIEGRREREREILGEIIFLFYAQISLHKFM